MKKFFTKPPFKLGPTKTPQNAAPQSTLPLTTHTTTVLSPKFTLPAVPHPCPHEHIALLATSEGLLLRPYLSKGTLPESHVRIAWGKEGLVEEIHNNGEDGGDWSEGVVVYGLVGILNLFTASHLLVITARSDVGYVFEPNQEVYAVKSVAVVTLTEARARAALKTISARNNANPRMSLIPTTSMANTNSIDDVPQDAAEAGKGNGARVKFATEEQVKVMTPMSDRRFELSEDDVDSRASSPADSITSSPSSEFSASTGNLAKALADRLSFWNKRASVQAPSIDRALSPDSEQGTHSRSSSEGRPSIEDMMRQGDKPADVLDNIINTHSPTPATAEQKNSELEDKIIRECISVYSKGGMYFAYRLDITRSIQHKQELINKSKKQNALLADLNALDDASKLTPEDGKVSVLAEPSPTLPLWRRVDRQYWWNEWLSKPLLDAGLHAYVLPLMQGFFQIARFGIPREPEVTEEGEAAVADYILVSRRSRDRAGLRYQRRGIDDDANVANFVETETILRVEREGFQNVFSHVQVRGSIPLFWSQAGYGLKPAPTLSPDRSHAQNLDALRRHVQRLLPRYGPMTIVNLAEQHGKEGAVTQSYRDTVAELGLEDVRYVDYDFHTETKGMKYENISQLIDQLQRTFEAQGYLWISNDLVMSQQKGVFRVNCIDCLDRTNVVESAFARHVLNRQLGSVALQYPSGAAKIDTDVVLNDVWANNGDAISREYAGTSALKGDFTRTGKRDLGGLLNDGVNSLARMYTSTFGDWFGQAVIDFMLGNRTISVFSEFLLKLQSSDPRDLIRISRIRAEAIAECVSRVLSEGERLLSGWTLFAPSEMNVRVGDKFEEKVLLLSVRALYIISYDYTLEKVKMYTRVPLQDIISISRGAYILSPLEEGSRDPLQNSGFILTWRNSRQATRVTSYSIGNNVEEFATPPSSPGFPTSPRSQNTPLSPRLGPSQTPSRRNTLSRILSNAAVPVLSKEVTFAAFKALPIDPARSRRENGSFFEPADELTGAANCKEAVDMMVEAIRRACAEAGGGKGEFIKDEDVVSLIDAQRMTSVYAKMEYGVKRLLWLGG